MEDNNKIIKLQDNQLLPTQLVDDVKLIVERGLREAYNNVNTVAIRTYLLIGKRIVEEEQHGQRRAEYGSRLIAMSFQKDLQQETCVTTANYI